MKRFLILAALLFLAAPAAAQVGAGANITFGPNCSNSTAATAGNCVQRDANGNAFSNNILGNGTLTTAAAGTTVLTASSSRYQALTGSTTQTYQLPDATTLSLGPWFVFNNNSSGALTVNNASSSAVYTVPAGGIVQCGPTSIGSAAGTWDCHGYVPSTVSWGTGTTGMQMNNALNTTAQIGAGASSCTAPNLVPQRANATTGFGSSASTNVCGVSAGAAVFTATATTFTVPGSLTPSSTGGIIGTTTNDSANAGSVGEYIESVVTVASPTTGFVDSTSKNITSISLTAGDWDVEGAVSTAAGASTTTSKMQAAISTTSNTLPSDELRQIQVASPGAGNNITAALPRRRFSLSGTTTIYLIGNFSFAVSTMGGAGFINARRVR